MSIHPLQVLHRLLDVSVDADVVLRLSSRGLGDP
jgi:hypothetical protein